MHGLPRELQGFARRTIERAKDATPYLRGVSDEGDH